MRRVSDYYRSVQQILLNVRKLRRTYSESVGNDSRDISILVDQMGRFESFCLFPGNKYPSLRMPVPNRRIYEVEKL